MNAQWSGLNKQGQKKIPISGPLIRAKAEEFAFSIGENDFKASTGWIDGLKTIVNDISFKTIYGESESVDTEATISWKDDFLQIFLTLTPKTFLTLPSREAQ